MVEMSILITIQDVTPYISFALRIFQKNP